MNISQRLSELRTAMGLSKNQLAKLAGISQSYISDIEAGKKNPTLDVIDRICQPLGITVLQFLQEDSEASLPADILQLIETTKKLPIEERKALNEYLKIRLSGNSSIEDKIEPDADLETKPTRSLPDMAGISLAAYGGAKRAEDLTDEDIDQLEKDLADFKLRKAQWVKEKERNKDDK